MPKKHENSGAKQQNHAPLNGALKYFLGGCAAEIYLLAVRRYYVNGGVDQLLAWDDILRYLMFAGLGLLVLGAVLTALWRKAGLLQRSVAWVVLSSGIFLAVGNWVIRTVYPTGSMVMCVVVPVVMFLGILWCLYSRECFYSLSILGSGIMAAWVCRHGAGTAYWGTPVLVGACVYLALLVCIALLSRKAEHSGGMVASWQAMPVGGSYTVLYGSCALSAAATLISLFSATLAYYAIWLMAIVVFALAVYYTVREL